MAQIRPQKRPAKRFEKGNYSISLPANFDADEILQSFEYRGDKREHLRDSMYFILHSLISRSALVQFSDETYIGLNWRVLREICGKNATEAIKILQKNNVIESNGSYRVGHFSKGYRLTNKYVNAEVKYRELHTPEIRNRLLKWINEKQEENNKALEKIGFITKWFDNNRLQINVQKTHYFIEFYHKELLSILDYTKHKFTPIERQIVENRITQRTNNMIWAVKMIKDGDFCLRKTGKDDRLHHTIGNLKKELRAFLTYDGQPLVSLDVMSSQPYLLTYTLTKDFYKPDRALTISTVYAKLNTSISTPNLTALTSINMPASSFQFLKDEGITPLSFSNIDWTKDFYTMLIDIESLLATSKTSVFKTRRQTKKAILLILYDKKNKNKPSIDLFGQLFPAEMHFINAINAVPGDAHLPILLQRLESKLILDFVCKRISEVYPDAPIIPVHDCIFTTEKFADSVRSIMIETMIKLTGFAPGIKKEIQDDTKILESLKETAKEDYQTIVNKSIRLKKGKKLHMPNESPIALKGPVIFEMPKNNDNQLLSTRYLDLSIDYSEVFYEG